MIEDCTAGIKPNLYIKVVQVAVQNDSDLDASISNDRDVNREARNREVLRCAHLNHGNGVINTEVSLGDIKGHRGRVPTRLYISLQANSVQVQKVHTAVHNESILRVSTLAKGREIVGDLITHSLVSANGGQRVKVH